MVVDKKRGRKRTEEGKKKRNPSSPSFLSLTSLLFSLLLVFSQPPLSLRPDSFPSHHNQSATILESASISCFRLPRTLASPVSPPTSLATPSTCSARLPCSSCSACASCPSFTTARAATGVFEALAAMLLPVHAVRSAVKEVVAPAPALLAAIAVLDKTAYLGVLEPVSLATLVGVGVAK